MTKTESLKHRKAEKTKGVFFRIPVSKIAWLKKNGYDMTAVFKDAIEELMKREQK